MKVGDLICLYDDWVFSEKECSLGIILDISRNTESGESSCYVLFTDGTTQWWYDYCFKLIVSDLLTEIGIT